MDSFVCPQPKPHIFSFKLTLLIWTTDTFLCPESQTLIYRQPHFTDTGYLRTAIFICALIVNIVSCSSNERFLRVSTILLESQRQAANVNLYHVTKFPIFLSFTVHYNYKEIISFMPALSMRIALSRFYQLIFYFEKFSS